MKSGDRVAMLSLNSQRYIEYFLAVPWADAVINPVNTRWSVPEIVYSLDDSETTVLIVDDAFKGVAERIASESKITPILIYAGDGETPEGMHGYEALIAEHEPVEDVRRGGDSLLGIFYTGGTTGFPKGVMISHTNIGFGTMSVRENGANGRNAIVLQVMPMFHMGGFANVAALLGSGGTSVVLPGFVPQTVLEAIANERVSEVLLAPTMIQMLLDRRDNAPEARALDVSSLDTIAYGASPITPALLDRARSVFVNAGFTQGYGMTELAPLATLLTAEYHTPEHAASGKMYSAGIPGSCVEVRIVDPEDRELPRGSIGEVVVRGPNVMLGYWNKPEATAEALRNGWMHTGDGGYMDEDGFVYVCDRLKDMIVSGGENVYSAEVETAMASHPAIGQCAAIGIPSDKWGESVHAVVVLKPDTSLTAEELIAHCRERIAGYKCPRSVEFRETLPLSGVGKVLKTELRKPYWENQQRKVG
ncbi:Long-chain-fatty-acid--CoA ligase [compost metagenome]